MVSSYGEIDFLFGLDAPLYGESLSLYVEMASLYVEMAVLTCFSDFYGPICRFLGLLVSLWVIVALAGCSPGFPTITTALTQIWHNGFSI